jgi:hypothetical protein
LLSLLPSAQDEVFLRLSGKQRSGAKKQGRAACIALGLLFVRNISHHTDATHAVSCLLECIDHIKILDEKVAVSSANALRSLDQRTLSDCVALNDSRIGRAMNSCFNIVFSGASRGSRDIHNAASLLLSHLLPIMKIADAVFLILNNCLSGNDDWMMRLSTWMIANNCPQEAFRCFVRAIQLTDIEIAVQVEQLFVNQASISATGPDNSNYFDEL